MKKYRSNFDNSDPDSQPSLSLICQVIEMMANRLNIQIVAEKDGVEYFKNSPHFEEIEDEDSGQAGTRKTGGKAAENGSN